MATAPRDTAAATTPERLVLYDGDCGVCNHTVQWILAEDPSGQFFFAPLTGPTAAAIRSRHPDFPAHADSIVYVERTGNAERTHVRSEAILRICQQLDSPRSRRIARLRMLPTWLTEIGYRLFALCRRQLSQRMSPCPLPSADQRRQMLP